MKSKVADQLKNRQVKLSVIINRNRFGSFKWSKEEKFVEKKLGFFMDIYPGDIWWQLKKTALERTIGSPRQWLSETKGLLEALNQDYNSFKKINGKKDSKKRIHKHSERANVEKKRFLLCLNIPNFVVVFHTQSMKTVKSLKIVDFCGPTFHLIRRTTNFFKKVGSVPYRMSKKANFVGRNGCGEITLNWLYNSISSNSLVGFSNNSWCALKGISKLNLEGEFSTGDCFPCIVCVGFYMLRTTDINKLVRFTSVNNAITFYRKVLTTQLKSCNNIYKQLFVLLKYLQLSATQRVPKVAQ